jgi:hypothetical protein
MGKVSRRRKGKGARMNPVGHSIQAGEEVFQEKSYRILEEVFSLSSLLAEFPDFRPACKRKFSEESRKLSNNRSDIFLGYGQSMFK